MDYQEILELLTDILANDLENFNEDFLAIRADDLHEMSSLEIALGIPNHFDMNAYVKKIEENTYVIGLLNGLFGIIPTKLTEFLARYDENDLLYFKKFESLDFLYDQNNKIGDTDKRIAQKKLASLFSSIIIVHILFHEVGHILANHTEEKIHTYEEFESSGKQQENFVSQEKELIADWYATKRLTKHIFNKITQTIDIKDSDLFFRNLFILIWLSLALEFQLFELKLVSNGYASLKDIEKRTHPHPKVRLFYCLDALQEALLDILNKEFSLTDEESTELLLSVFHEGNLYLESFYSLLTSVDIDKGLVDEKVIEVYKTIRETPYTENYSGGDSWKHLEPMHPEYIRSLNDMLASINREN